MVFNKYGKCENIFLATQCSEQEILAAKIHKI